MSERDSAEQVRILPPDKLCFSRDSFGKVHLRIAPDEEHREVRFVRLLPLSEPRRYIMVLSGADNEVGIIDDLDALPPEARDIVEQELEVAYFTPRITRIVRADSKSGVVCFEVETDRGPAKIFVRDRNDIRFYPNGRVVILDINGVHYEIPNLAKLDRKSQLRFEEQT